MSERLQDWVFDPLLDSEALLRAVFIVYERYDREGLKPGSERWIFDEIEYGPRLFADVRRQWMRQVKAPLRLTDDPSCFPYTMSFVRRALLSVRKFDDAKTEAVRRRLGLIDWPLPGFDE